MKTTIRRVRWGVVFGTALFATELCASQSPLNPGLSAGRGAPGELVPLSATVLESDSRSPVALAGSEDSSQRHERYLHAGTAVTGGNTRTLQLTGSVEARGELGPAGRYRAFAEGNYGESRTERPRETIAENARASLNLQRSLDRRWFAALDVSTQHDPISDLAHRTVVAGGLGAYLWSRNRASVSADAGLGYLWERVAGENREHPVFRLSARAERHWGRSARGWLESSYVPKTGDLSDYGWDLDAVLEVALNERLRLRNAARVRYDSTPAESRRKADYSLVSGVGVRW